MVYNIWIHPKCQEQIYKLCRKNPVMEEALRKKMNEIVQKPSHYKPLGHDLAGLRRVHIMKSFVLQYEINESKQEVRFLTFDHHDDAYRR